MWKEVSHKPARRIDTTTDRTSIALCDKKTETLQSVEPDHLTAANWNRNRGILTTDTPQRWDKPGRARETAPTLMTITASAAGVRAAVTRQCSASW